LKPKITVAYGDGIGPEIMSAALEILQAGGGVFDMDEIEIGEKVYREGHTSGIRDEAWQKIVDNRVLFKAPITTPQGGGYKSVNVTIRKTLGLFANVRPVKALHPFVSTKHPQMDAVIVRENEEDLYAGIEHRQTREVVQCLKLITRPGCEKIIRYAFEYAKNAGRNKVTCMTKDNIMKLTDGLFHKVFDEIAGEYGDIESEHWIIDIGAAKFADAPENFDVIVTPNLYGDVLSDISAQIAGSVGIAGSANIGQACSMFEAIHGSAPRRAGQNIANPSGLLMGGIQMLNHLGQNEAAERIENAWLKTIEDGIHTYDIYNESHSRKKVTTSEFAGAIIERLGERPQKLKPVTYPEKAEPIQISLPRPNPTVKKLDGVDVFIDEDNRNPDALAEKLQSAAAALNLGLLMITNRGVKVFPGGNPHTFCTDHWRCRFTPKNGTPASPSDILDLLQALNKNSLEVIKTENLYSFDDERGYSLGQGQ
jgi:isocitrate dehydrogenase